MLFAALVQAQHAYVCVCVCGGGGGGNHGSMNGTAGGVLF